MSVQDDSVADDGRFGKLRDVPVLITGGMGVIPKC